jgi:hypothetical protein
MLNMVSDVQFRSQINRDLIFSYFLVQLLINGA